VHLLGRSNGVEDPVLGNFGLLMVGKIHLAGETRIFSQAATIISIATPAKELREPVLAVVHVYRHGKSPP